MKNSNSNNSETAIVRDLEFHWAHLQKPHNPFGTEIWDVQIRTTDKEKVAELKKHGINMKTHEDGYFFGNVKRKTVNNKGESMEAPKIVDAAKKEVTEVIGNGSKGHIKVFAYDYKVGPNKGRTAQLTAVQVIDLIPYEASSSTDFEDESGEDQDVF